MDEKDTSDVVIVPDDEYAKSNATDYEVELNPLQEKIVSIAEELMDKHYILDSKKLYYACAREVRSHDNPEIMLAIDRLIKRKVLFPGKATTRDDVLANENRKAIFDAIQKDPGIHFSLLRERVDLDSNTLLWHIRMLEKFDFIRIEKFGNSTVFFEYFLEKQMDDLYFYLHKTGSPEIFKEILTEPDLSFRELMKRTDFPRTTLVRKLKVLIEKGFLRVEYTSNRITSIKVAQKYREVCLKYLYNMYWKDLGK